MRSGCIGFCARITCCVAEAKVRGHDRFQPWVDDIPEPGPGAGSQRDRSALGGRLTYVRLELEFVYLAVILDAFSRRVIGWALDRTLEDALTLSALGMALKQRQPKPGLTITPTEVSNTLRPTTPDCSSNTASGSA